LTFVEGFVRCHEPFGRRIAVDLHRRPRATLSSAVRPPAAQQTRQQRERSMTAKTPEDRIGDLGLALPPPARAVANYVPWAITGNLVMTSGNLPWRDGKLAYVGQIGRELSGDDGYKSCQLSCLNALAQIKEAVGELAKVKRIVRLEGVLSVADGYKEHPKCLDGASDLINTAFEEKGRHTRMIYTNPVMPLDCTSLVVLFAEIE
jgi:enamine deaminase RidA (YjgF/YER057c/UK114 family)